VPSSKLNRYLSTPNVPKKCHTAKIAKKCFQEATNSKKSLFYPMKCFHGVPSSEFMLKIGLD